MTSTGENFWQLQFPLNLVGYWKLQNGLHLRLKMTLSRHVHLRNTALEFLREFKKNKLDVYDKLQNLNIMTSVTADALMFVHIYVDLVTLAKSEELNKSVYDMTIHYLELDGF